jgi:hypothetical protein
MWALWGFTLLCSTALVRLRVTAQPLGISLIALFVYAHVAMCVRSSPTHIVSVPPAQVAKVPCTPWILSAVPCLQLPATTAR